VIGLVREWEKLDAGVTRDGAELAPMNAKGKALPSLLTHERGLCVFFDDPREPMENNLIGEDFARARDLVLSQLRFRRAECSQDSRAAAGRTRDGALGLAERLHVGAGPAGGMPAQPRSATHGRAGP